jgi:hypothetical protein
MCYNVTVMTKPRGKKPTCSCGCGYDGEKPDHKHCALCLQALEDAKSTIIELRVNIPWYYHKRCYDYLAGLRTFEYIAKTTSQKNAADDNDITPEHEIANPTTPAGVLALFDSDDKAND